MSLELPGSAGSSGSEFQDSLVSALSSAGVIDMCRQARCGCRGSEPRSSSSQGKHGSPLTDCHPSPQGSLLNTLKGDVK